MTPKKEINCQCEDVLAAFLKQCPNPTGAQIADWCDRYPAHASDIADLCADMIDMELESQAHSDDEPSKDELAVAHVEMLELIRHTERSESASAQNREIAIKTRK